VEIWWVSSTVKYELLLLEMTRKKPNYIVQPQKLKETNASYLETQIVYNLSVTCPGLLEPLSRSLKHLQREVYKDTILHV
jgi:hypothetical protein